MGSSTLSCASTGLRSMPERSTFRTRTSASCCNSPRLSRPVAVAVGVVLPVGVAAHPVTRLLIAWNAGTVLYVVLAATMMVRSSNQEMRYRAQLQDDGQLAILVLVCLAAIASLAAMAGELAVV